MAWDAAKQGLARCTKENAEDLPEAYTVLCVDIGPDELKARYPGNDVVHAYIDAAMQERRNYRPPSKAFVRSLWGGVHEPVIYIPLGPDRYKKSHSLIFSGNKRIVGARMSNVDRKVDGLPPNAVRGIPKSYAGTAAEKGDKARDLKALSNAREPMTVTDQAELAAEYNGGSMPLEDILIRVGARNEKEYRELVEIAALMPSLSKKALDALDSGAVKLTRARKLAKLSKSDQDADLVPKERAAYGSKKKAAPKPMAPAALALPWSEKGGKRVVEQLAEKGYEAQADLIRLLSGDFSAVGEMDPDLLELLDSAGITITPPEEAEEAAE